MEGIKWNVRALAANLKISIKDLAEASGIDANHLQAVSMERVAMTADDLIKLATYTGVDPFKIKY